MTSGARTYTQCAWAACDISAHAAYWSRVDLSYTKWRHFSKENMISKRYKFPLFGHTGHNRIYYNSYGTFAFKRAIAHMRYVVK